MRCKWPVHYAAILLSTCCAISFICSLVAQGAPNPQDVEAPARLAATPPMGWNSWDSYAETVSESNIKANAAWMAAHLKAYGWEYIVVDEGWYVTNHTGETNGGTPEFSLDAYGRYIPAVNSI